MELNLLIEAAQTLDPEPTERRWRTDCEPP